jgi:hypothetical protein
MKDVKADNDVQIKRFASKLEENRVENHNETIFGSSVVIGDRMNMSGMLLVVDQTVH